MAYLQKASTIILKIYYKGPVILHIYTTQGFVNPTSMEETEIPLQSKTKGSAIVQVQLGGVRYV